MNVYPFLRAPAECPPMPPSPIPSGTEPMAFTCALHTYYRVEAIGDVEVRGLKGSRYLDNLQVGHVTCES